MDKVFVTGCDFKTEWQLEWFLKNYLKYNDTPIVFCDFGVSPEMRSWIKLLSGFSDAYAIPQQPNGGWFYKPSALLHSPHKETVWLDTDMQVLGDLSGVFDLLEDNRLAMVEDRPWTKRRGETWHNSGFVGVRGKPPILKRWFENTTLTTATGDQEVLHEMLRVDPLTRLRYITDLPNKYNWLRIQIENDNEDSWDKLIVHWTGTKGNDVIRKMIYNGQ